MIKKIFNQIKPLLGKKCCRVMVGEPKSLRLGFGRKIFHHNERLYDTYYGEWELGTYYCSWRVMKNNHILVAKDDSAHRDILTKRLKKIVFGHLISIDQLTDIDVRISFDSGIVVDFIATISDDDHYFHIFGPDHFYVDLSGNGKWTVSKSNEPSVHRK
jgi:hypothetical protein